MTTCTALDSLVRYISFPVVNSIHSGRRLRRCCLNCVDVTQCTLLFHQCPIILSVIVVVDISSRCISSHHNQSSQQLKIVLEPGRSLKLLPTLSVSNVCRSFWSVPSQMKGQFKSWFSTSDINYDLRFFGLLSVMLSCFRRARLRRELQQ